MSPLISKLLAVSLAVGVALMAVFGILLPIHDRLGETDQEIARLTEQLARFSEMGTEVQIEAGIEIADAVLLAAESAVIAAADLQDVVENAIADGGGDLQSVRTEDPVKLDGAQRLPLTADFTTDAAGLQEILHALETAQPYLIITDLTARRMFRRAESENREIAVRIRLYGVLRGV